MDMSGKNSGTQKSAQEIENLVSQSPLDEEVRDIVVANLNDSAMALAACQGADPLALGATEAAIVCFVVDASGSMSKVADQVRQSVRESVEAMVESKQASALTLSLISFNQLVNVAFANKPVEDVVDRDIVYFAVGRTALYDAVVDALTGALAYEEMLLQAGLITKVIVVVFSDGADNASRTTTATARALTDELRRRENWILAFVGFKTYEADYGIDYEVIADQMGFPALLEIELTGDVYQRRHAIRSLFQLISKSVISVSQTTIDPSAPTDFFAT